MQQDFWYAYLKLLLPGELTRVSDKYMNDMEYITKLKHINSKEYFRNIYDRKEAMDKPIKSRECWMVQCLFEEVMKHPHKFSEMDTGYIKDLNTKFFNDPNYLLSEKQIKWLDIIWEK